MFLIIIWLFVFVTIKICGGEEIVLGKGINVINGEYHRYFTSLLYHQNVIHLLANCFGIYWVNAYLKEYIHWKYILVVTILGGIVTNVIFSFIYPNSTSFGGSPMVYALIGISMVMIFNKHCEFRLGTWYGNSILAYAIWANLPLIAGDVSILVIHAVAFGVGIIITLLLEFLGMKLI